MEYRGCFYKEIQVTNYRNESATMFKCSDVALLEYTDITFFTKFSEKRMKESIDEYLDNTAYYMNLKKLTYKATKEFLQTKHD
jgi:hypothetical protein